MDVDEFSQHIWDMNTTQLCALWKFVYHLWAHRAMTKLFPRLCPPSTLPATIAEVLQENADD